VGIETAQALEHLAHGASHGGVKPGEQESQQQDRQQRDYPDAMLGGVQPADPRREQMIQPWTARGLERSAAVEIRARSAAHSFETWS
jgi:hypothetical protein